MLRPHPREQYTVGWVCALPIELAAAQEMLDEEHGSVQRFDNDDNLYYLGSIAGHNVVIVCLPAGRIGNSPAAAVATQTRATFPGIQFGLMVGIGGGVPSEEADIRLGDVVVSQPCQTFGGVVQYDIGKATPSGFQRTGQLNSPPHMLLVAIASVQANEARGRSTISQHVAKLNEIPRFRRDKAGADVLFETTYDHQGGYKCDKCSSNRQEYRESRESEDEVVVHYGTIASGNQVIKSAVERDRVSADLEGVLCFEMEAAGLMNTFPCLVIRGICDYSDSHKNKKWQPHAAAAAAAYAKEILSVIPEETKTYTAKELTCGTNKHNSQSHNGPPAKRRKLDHPEGLENGITDPQTLTLTHRSQNQPITETSLKLSPREQDCLRSLSFPEQEQRYNNIYTAIDTCEWLLKDPQYQAWLEKSHGLFWIKGNPGSGKSVLMKYAVRKIRETKSNDLIVSFFIHGRGTDLQKSQLGLFRAILSSLLDKFPKYLSELVKTFEERERRHGRYTEDRWTWADIELQELLSLILIKEAKNQTVIIFVDALDECGEGPARSLLAYFKDLAKQAEQRNAQLKLCFSSRHYPILGLGIIPSIFVEERNNKDIQWYTRERLKDTRLGLKRQQIEDEILLKAQGGFQWVLLVTEMVINGNLKGIRSEKLLNQLASCPETLSELYRSILSGISGTDHHQMVKLFQWVLFAERPLSAQELRDALGCDKDMNYTTIAELRTHECWSNTLQDFERYVQNISRGLVEFQTREIWELYEPDGEDSNREAQLIHQSVADYFLDEFLLPRETEYSQQDYRSPTGSGHFQISRSCLKYLTLSDILADARLPRGAVSQKFPLAPYAMQHLFKHVQKVEQEGIAQPDLLSAFHWEPQSQTTQQLADLWRTLDPDSVHAPLGWPFFGSTMFHILAAFGSKSAFDHSLESNAGDPVGRDSHGNTPLHIAIEENHQDIALTILDRLALKQHQNKEKIDENNCKDMSNGHQATSLIDVNAKNNDGDTALNFALEQEAGEVIMKLIDVGADLEYLGQKTGLVSYAIRSRNKQLVARLIENNIALDGAIYYAVDILANEDHVLEELITELVKTGASTYRLPELPGSSEDDDESSDEEENMYDNDAVILASRKGLASVVKLLISHGALATRRNKIGEFPLLVAADEGHEEVVKLLLNTDGFNVNWVDDDGVSPLWAAASNGYEAVVKTLLETGKANVNLKDNDGETPLWAAASNGKEAVIKALLETGKADVNLKNHDGVTPLLVAASKGEEVVVKVLVETGKADVNLKDNNGETPLWAATSNGKEAVVKVLLETGKADINSKDGHGRTPLWRAANKGHEAVVKLLLEIDQTDADLKDDDGVSPLWTAASNGKEAVVKALLETGKAEVNSKDIYGGYTPLRKAAELGYEAVVKLLLETDKFDANLKDNYGVTPLLAAASNGDEAVVKALLETGKADINPKDGHGRTPLWRAADNGHEAVVKRLLETGKADIDCERKHGETPLWVAAKNGHEAVVKRLLKTGKADVNVKTNDGGSPLWAAAANGHDVVVRRLLEASKANVDCERIYGDTPLRIAAINGHEKVVRLLIDIGDVNVDLNDCYGYTPLWWATMMGHEAVVKLLLNTGKTNFNFSDKYGRTPLWLAAERGHESIVKLLLGTGKVDVNMRNKDGVTPLWTAASKGYEAVVKVLLDTGKADVDSKDRRGYTPLRTAAENGNMAVVRLLLETDKADANWRDKDGVTPLLAAASNGYETVVKVLLDMGKVDVDLKDNYGRTPLSWAAATGHDEVVKMLVESGKAVIDSKDIYGHTPLSRALVNKHQEVVKVLEYFSNL